MTQSKNYNIIFKGQVIQGFEVPHVKKKMASLFKIQDMNKVEKYFTSKPVKLKKGVDYSNALRYKEKLESIGMECELEAIEEIEPAPVMEQSNDSMMPSNQYVQNNIECPKCGYFQKESEECVRCGIIFSKYIAEKNNEENPEDLMKKVESQPNPNERITCPRCGHDQPGALKCEKCGIVFDKYDPTQEAEESPLSEITPIENETKQAAKKEGMFIGIVVCILAIGIVAIIYGNYVYMSKKNKVAMVEISDIENKSVELDKKEVVKPVIEKKPIKKEKVIAKIIPKKQIVTKPKIKVVAPDDSLTEVPIKDIGKYIDKYVWVILKNGTKKECIMKVRCFSVFCLAMFLVFSSGVNIFAQQTKNDQVQKLLDQGWNHLSQMHIDKSGLNKAVKCYEKVVEIDPKNKDVYWKLAEITFKIAQETPDADKSYALHEKALSYGEKAVEIAPNSTQAHYWVGTSNACLAEKAGVFQALGLVRKAIAELSKSIELSPESRFAVLSKAILAIIYAEAPWPVGSLSYASDYAQSAAKMDPNLTLASLNLAKVHVANGEYKKAKKELNRCLAIKSPTYLWDSTLYDWPKAKKLLEEIKNK